MATVVFSAAALDHVAQAFEFLRREAPGALDAAAGALGSAATLLAAHPLAGRRLRGEIRELVISSGQAGHVALYRFLPLRQEVRILALRHQRELHFRP